MAKYKVLLVDDDEDTLVLYERLLDEAGYKVLQARNGNEAVEQARKNSPDIIVMDIMMPELDGIASVLKLKSDEKTRKIPVIVCTAVKTGDDEIVARNLGVADYVVKSPRMGDLVEKIGKVLNK